jgi:hypothetical protein
LTADVKIILHAKSGGKFVVATDVVDYANNKRGKKQSLAGRSLSLSLSAMNRRQIVTENAVCS